MEELEQKLGVEADLKTLSAVKAQPGKGRRLGAHLTITKGLDKAALFADSIGANTFQYFTRNPRGGAARLIGGEEIGRWQAARQKHDIFPIVGHLPYTVNLAAGPGRLRDFARMVLEEDLRRIAEIGGEVVVSHPGHYEGEGREEGIERLAQLVGVVLAEAGPGPVLCLEVMALQGSELGSLEDLEAIIKRLDSHPRLGVWLDSAHLFAAGWDLRKPEGCRELVAELDRRVGLERVKGMHLNDSKAALGSRRDRHAKIGQGELKDEGIAALVNHPFLGSLPLLLETPVEKYEEYEQEIARVKGLLTD